MVFNICCSHISSVFLSVVFPNIAKIYHALLLLASGVLALGLIKAQKYLSVFFQFYIASFVITVIYVIVGYINDSSYIAIAQILFIYVLSPLLWAFIFAAIIENISIDKVINFSNIIVLLACFGVYLFLFVYQNFGSEVANAIFDIERRAHIRDGYVASTLHVYGSLIFFCGAYFASPNIVNNHAFRIIIILALFVAALTSGRAALFISIFVGASVGLLSSTGSIRQYASYFIAAVSVILVLLAISTYYGDIVNLDLIISRFLSHLSDFGGSARSEQFIALIEGIESNYGLGSGHGVGVSYLRSHEYPWRYELVWVATVYRVGFLGSLVYIAPFAYAYWCAFFLLKKNLFFVEDRFMLGGMTAALLASGTNPYIEGYVFHWMFVFPALWFYMRRFSYSRV